MQSAALQTRTKFRGKKLIEYRFVQFIKKIFDILIFY